MSLKYIGTAIKIDEKNPSCSKVTQIIVTPHPLFMPK